MSQSEWSDDDDSDGANRNNDGGDEESTGYVTDDPALDNMSVTNEHGLTDAEGISLPSCTTLCIFVSQ